MAQLSSEQVKLFQDPNFAALGTIRGDGSPHVSPVWVDYDGERVVFNTARGRAKEKQMIRDGRATLTVWSRENPYSYVEVTGPVELVDEGADEHIDAMAKKYSGVDEYPNRSADEKRVIVKVTPELVTGR